jgi:hypothetical protein
VYRHGWFEIYTLVADGGEPVNVRDVPVIPRLPPVDAGNLHRQREPMRKLDEPAQSAPHEPWPVLQYKPRLSLNSVSQVSFGIGIDRLGAAVDAGIGLAFSDVLNTHWLIASVQPNQQSDEGLSLRDTAASVAYINQAHRWNWGVAGGYVPYLAAVRGTIRTGEPSAPEATPVLLVRQTERAGSGLLTYAFNRARRMELRAGFSHLTFDDIVDPGVPDIPWTIPTASLTLTTATAAVVGDSSNFGPTSPVRGERYRIEVTPTLGTIRYLNVLADYRRYMMPVPFYTIAVRALHIGRYGSGSDDPRLSPLYLGSPSLVRGYGLSEDSAAGCVSLAAGGCDETERMLGSRLAVANVELRFPLLRFLGISPRMYGPSPMEMAFFVDGGLTWNSPRSPSAFVRRGRAMSAGLSLRTNVLGLGLAQLDVVRPFDRADGDWTVQFNLAPAF